MPSSPSPSLTPPTSKRSQRRSNAHAYQADRRRRCSIRSLRFFFLPIALFFLFLVLAHFGISIRGDAVAVRLFGYINKRLLSSSSSASSSSSSSPPSSFTAPQGQQVHHFDNADHALQSLQRHHHAQLPHHHHNHQRPSKMMQKLMNKLDNKLKNNNNNNNNNHDDDSRGGNVGGGPPPIPQRPVAALPGHGGGGSGKRNVGYFINWGIYDRKYFPSNIPVHHLTHINYAFANVRPETGEVVLSDSWSDVEIHYEGDSWNEGEGNLYGNFKALYKLKQQNRNLKLLLSIGGWSYRENFKCLIHESHRENFVRSAVKLVEDLGLDGLDIDWEYPETSKEAQTFVLLLRDLRTALNSLAASKGSRENQYELTVAAPCGQEQIGILKIREMDQYLDFWNLMAYDFSGSWDEFANHASNMYAGGSRGNSVDSAVRAYLAAGVRCDKIVLGIPAYGKSFLGAEGIGRPFNKHASSTAPNEGNIDYKDLPLPGSSLFSEDAKGADYSYDPNLHQLVSHETPRTAYQKAQYISSHGLGGAMFWDLSMDCDVNGPRGHESLIRILAENMGGGGESLQWRENELRYPMSKYHNLAQGTI